MFIQCFAIICIILHTVICTENSRQWKRYADNDIHEALEYKRNENVAKNIILFVGDGMDLNTVTAARIHNEGEDKFLAFEKFENIGLLKTYSANKLVPDSCSTATALFSGVKVNHKTAGVSATVQYEDCENSIKSENQLKTIIDWAQESGKYTGFVTTTRVTHATPSALYAHTPDRHWECEAKMPSTAKKCKDIARQLIQDAPGKNINVIFGGGKQCLVSHVMDEKTDPIDNWACYSKDGRNLLHEWEKDKQKRDVSHTFVQNRFELLNIDTDANEFILGIFSNSHMHMCNENGTLHVAYPRRKTLRDQPSLKEMTEIAIKSLHKNENGYLLMVEGGLIDYAHHRGRARSALEETAEFSNAIQKALELTKEESDHTLIIVTSDHAHSLLFNGYPSREQGVLGIAQPSKWDGVPYTTLMYGTGGPNNYQYEITNGTVRRRDPTNDNTTSYVYSQQAGVVTDETTHGGSDVVVYAKGPMSHLFNTVHEQTHVAYVIAYAAKMGPYKDRDLTNYSEDISIPKYYIYTIISTLFTTFVSTLILF